MGFPGGSDGKESTCNAGYPSSIPGSGRSAGEGIGYHSSILGLPWWLSWKRICLQCGRPGFDPWVGKIPCRRERLPTPVFWPREFHGLYSPWGCKDSDMTEGLSLSVFFFFLRDHEKDTSLQCKCWNEKEEYPILWLQLGMCVGWLKCFFILHMSENSHKTPWILTLWLQISFSIGKFII